MQCPKCGAEQRSATRFCGRCGALLTPSPTPDRPERPGCVTFYAALMGVGLFLGIYAGYTELRQGLSWNGAWSVVLGLAGAASAVGLLRLRRWGRILVIVTVSFNLAVRLVQAGLSVAQGADPLRTASVELLVLAVGGYVIYWFVSQRALFH